MAGSTLRAVKWLFVLCNVFFLVCFFFCFVLFFFVVVFLAETYLSKYMYFNNNQKCLHNFTRFQYNYIYILHIHVLRIG